MIEYTFIWPCGTIIHEKIGLFAAILGRFHFDAMDGCPLHGKGCGKENETNNL